MNRISKTIVVIVSVFFTLGLHADVAFQSGWDREPVNSTNISDEVDLENFLKDGSCSKVVDYAKDETLSAVVARGSHGNDDDPRAHYTVRLYNCPNNQLGYIGYVLKCDNSKWAGTYHVLENGSCD